MTDHSMRIDRSTLVPIGLLIAVVLGAVAGTWQLSLALADFDKRQLNRDHEITLKFHSIEEQLRQLRSTADAAGLDQWRKKDMRDWVARLRELNKDKIEVPEVER